MLRLESAMYFESVRESYMRLRSIMWFWLCYRHATNSRKMF